MSAGPLSTQRAEALAAALDLGLPTIPICEACLSFVSFALDDDDNGHSARREARRMAPDLWNEGLEEPALASLRRARDAGVRDADVALRDIEGRGARSAVVRAIVLRLAEQQAARARALEEARARSGPVPPDEAVALRLRASGFRMFDGPSGPRDH